jgi:hypothetical protein
VKAILAILVICLGCAVSYAYSWKRAAESMQDLACVNLLTRGQTDASALLRSGNADAAIHLLSVLLDESTNHGRVCRSSEESLAWSFPLLSSAIGQASEHTSAAFQDELRALLVLAYRHDHSDAAAEQMIGELARSKFEGNIDLAQRFVSSYEKTVLGIEAPGP